MKPRECFYTLQAIREQNQMINSLPLRKMFELSCQERWKFAVISYFPQRRGEYFSAERDHVDHPQCYQALTKTFHLPPFENMPWWNAHKHQFHKIINCVFSLFVKQPALQDKLIRREPGRKWVRLMQRLASQIQTSQSLSENNLLGPSQVTDTPPQFTATRREWFCGWKDITCTPLSIHRKLLLCLLWQTQGHGTLCNRNEHPSKEAWIEASWRGEGSLSFTL